jgi:hypothetical protein
MIRITLFFSRIVVRRPRCSWSPLMDWVISSTEEATGRVRETHFATETSFHAALKDMFSDVGTRFLSAELPGGRVLDEDAARELVGAPHGSSWQ